MSEKNKFRLMCAGAVVVLLIMAVPYVINNAREPNHHLVNPSSIPDAPNKPLVAVSEPEEFVSAPLAHINLDSEWEIYLGAFRNEVRVKQLVRQLQEHGYNSYTRKGAVAGTMMIFVGPKENRQAADQLAKVLQREFKVRGVVQRKSEVSA